MGLVLLDPPAGADNPCVDRGEIRACLLYMRALPRKLMAGPTAYNRNAVQQIANLVVCHAGDAGVGQALAALRGGGNGGDGGPDRRPAFWDASIPEVNVNTSSF